MHKMFTGISIILAISLMFTGCSGGNAVNASAGENSQGGGPPGTGGQMAAEATSVDVLTLSKTGIVNTLKFTGTINAKDSYNVSPEVSGKVEKVNFEVGDTVNEGDILFTIDDTDTRNSITQYEASLASANANVKAQQTKLAQLDGSSRENTLMNLTASISTAQASLERAEITLNNSEIELAQAKENMQNAKTTYEQAQQLFTVGGYSQTELDNAETAYNQQTASYDKALLTYEQNKIALNQAKETLANAERSYDITVNQSMPEDKQSAQDSLNSAVASRNTTQVSLDQARDKLEKLAIKSPMTGVISARNVDPGANVQTSATAFTIISLDKVTVETNISEQLAAAIGIGDTVSVTITTISAEPFEGRIFSISPTTDSTGTYPVKIELDNKAAALKAGMHAEVSFVKEKSEAALAVPVDAVLTDETGYYVYTIVDGKAAKTTVTTGINNGNVIELTSGVSENDQVIISGQSYVLNGDPVSIISGSGDQRSAVDGLPDDAAEAERPVPAALGEGK